MFPRSAPCWYCFKLCPLPPWFRARDAASRLLLQWPLTALCVQNLELCAEAHWLLARLLWLALDVCERGTRSLVSRVDDGRLQPAAIGVCSRVLVRCRLRTA